MWRRNLAAGRPHQRGQLTPTIADHRTVTPRTPWASWGGEGKSRSKGRRTNEPPLGISRRQFLSERLSKLPLNLRARDRISRAFCSGVVPRNSLGLMWVLYLDWRVHQEELHHVDYPSRPYNKLLRGGERRP
jgi:hypothetical protein